jgi:drug/metabolite transporter (DMT)-like permease
MSAQVLLLLVLAGVMHSSWNLLSKGGKDRQVFLWLAISSTTLLFLGPFLLFYRPFPVQAWPIIALSGALEAIYYLLLGAAYRYGDLSLVYPLARGSAPLFVTIIAVLFLGERLSLIGVIGIGLIVCGIYCVHLRSFALSELARPLLALRGPAARLALLCGLSIAGYSSVDKVGLRYVSPLTYIYLIFAVSALYLLPYMLLARREAIKVELEAHRFRIVLAALLSMLSYLCVLFALQQSPVSYIASMREIAVIFAAIMGTLILHESFGLQKITGSFLIFCGVICIALLS